MGRYAGAETAVESEKTPRLPIGKFLTVVDRIVDGESNDVEFWVADVKIVHVFTTQDEDTVADSTRSIFVKLNVPKMRMANIGKIRNFVRAATSSLLGQPVKLDDIGEQHIEESAGEDQPLTGAVLVIEGYNKDKADGSPFTHYRVSVPSEDELKAAGLA